MPVTFAQARSVTRAIAFEWEGETVNLKYRVNTLDRAFAERLQEAGAALVAEVTSEAVGAARVREFVGAFLELVSWWDVVEEQGGPTLPLTLDRLAEPIVEAPGENIGLLYFLTMCIRAAVEDAAPKASGAAPSSAPSADTSSAAASATSSPPSPARRGPAPSSSRSTRRAGRASR